MATITMSRDELMGKLLEAKARADREDAKAAARHKKDEEAALQKFRAGLRRALKWDWKTAKAKWFRVDHERPTCPTRNARLIELAITQVKMDSRKGRLRLHEHSDWYKAATWLPESEQPKKSVCD